MSEQKTRLCKYGCGTEIYWDNTANAYMEVKLRRTHKGNCSKFKDFKQTAQKIENEIATATISGSTITPSPNQSIFKKNDALGKVAELEIQYASDMKEMNRRVTRAEQAIQALVAELSFKKGTEVKQDRDEEVVQED